MILNSHTKAIFVLKDYLEASTKLIEKHLNKLLPEQEVPYRNLFKAARYSLLGPGKRLRPILTLATAETLGADPTAALGFACALEMVHTYSLIHDDLPCMDDDDFRRGRPTLHKAFPESHAVLAGDYLLTFAFDTLVNDSYLTPQQKIRLIDLLAKKSGSFGMIGGQILDIEAEGKEITLEQLTFIHRCKTGALLTASIEAGAIISEAEENIIQTLRRYSENIGLAYQVIDDILDVTQSEQKHGKAISSDVINGKTTYVSLLGLEVAEQTAKDLLANALAELKTIPFDTTILSSLATYLIHRQY